MIFRTKHMKHGIQIVVDQEDRGNALRRTPLNLLFGFRYLAADMIADDARTNLEWLRGKVFIGGQLLYLEDDLHRATGHEVIRPRRSRRRYGLERQLMPEQEIFKDLFGFC